MKIHHKIIGLLIFPFGLPAQNNLNITGAVLDKIAKEGLPYATVALLDTDKKIVSGATTDEKGSFQISAKSADTVLHQGSIRWISNA